LAGYLTVEPTPVLDGTQTTNTLTWNFNSGSESFSFLAAGETFVLTYSIQATDDDGTPLSDTETVTITITGGNNTPDVFVGAGDSAAETLAETNGTLTSTGTLSVTDSNVTDIVTSSVTGVTASGTTTGLGSDTAALLAMLSSTPDVLDNTQTAGQLTWNFNSSSEAFDYLAVGESLILTYTITVTDSQSATDTQTVVITITGTNDAPTITVVDVNGAVTEDASTPTLTDSGSITFAELDETDVISSSVALASTSTTGPAIPTDLANALNSSA
jgi:VCBS repeat-containing protein